jgi:hypothetical protein
VVGKTEGCAAIPPAHRKRRSEDGVKATIGRIVTYRSKTGNYDVPAIVTATVDTLNPEGVEAGAVPALSDDDCVHLTVFSPGLPITGPNLPRDRDAQDLPEGMASFNLAGCYQEHDVPFAEGPPYAEPDQRQPAPGTWRWPERV